MFSMPLIGLLGASTVFALYLGRAVKKISLPSLVGYMILGVILGKSVLDVFTESDVRSLGFLTDVALAFVAFTIGSELNVSGLKKLGKSIIFIILAESFAAFAVVTAAVWLLTGNLPMAILFGSLAPASAPAGTVAVIQEYGARGSLTKALYAVVGFDDGLAIVIFGFANAAARNMLTPDSSLSLSMGVLQPTKEILLSLAIGAVLGYAFTLLSRRLKPVTDIPALTFGFLALCIGIAQALHLSLILTAMMLGFVLTNTTPSTLVKAHMNQLKTWISFLFIPFFFLAGAHLDLAVLPSLGLLGIVYITARTLGLMGGAWLGASLGGSEPKIRKYLGFGILSQAGVAIGLSMLVLNELNALGTPEANSIATTIITTITATCIVFEIVGPIGAKYALTRAGEIGKSR